MARMVAIYKAPKDPAAFQRHYFETHVPLAKKLPGLRRYEVSEGPVVSPAGGPVHFVATLHFDDMAAIRAAFASPEGRACAADRRDLAPEEGDAMILLFDERAV
jgi:uncharacterized protein (TIGR02118 family)